MLSPTSVDLVVTKWPEVSLEGRPAKITRMDRVNGEVIWGVTTLEGVVVIGPVSAVDKPTGKVR